jgi:para-nitrobenzyl esterase
VPRVIVRTSAGAVRGETVDGVHSFKGIPYAADPAGERRFLPPRPAPPWARVRDARAYGPTAPQPAAPPWRLDTGSAVPESESCLVLNVWTASQDGTRPVLVWLHGGGFSTGSGSQPWYDGSALARRDDVVVVTLNHRLGLLGFLDLGSVAGPLYEDAGHAGLLDLVAALTWVRDEIASFGGDPARVTIFGESGGGGKVLALLAMPAAAGLFSGAIVQSGAFLDGPGERGQEPAVAADLAREVVERLGGVEAVLAAPVERLVGVQVAIEGRHRPGSGGVMPFCPIVDGRVLPDHPLDALAAGASAEVPLVLGTNRHETTLFLWFGDEAFREDPLGWEPADDAVPARLAGYVGDRLERLVATYRELRPGITNRDLTIAISTDNLRMSAVRLAEAKLEGGTAPVYVYRFDWESPLHGGALGATHALEIPFVFDTTERRAASRDGAGRKALAASMSDAWVRFASGVAPWTPYTLDRRETMLFGTTSRIVADPDREERLAWLE